MPAAAPSETVVATEDPVLLPSASFYVRRMPLDPAGDAASQVEIALEAQAPFAAAQLFYGFVRAADGKTALAFATHRRLFAPEAWDGATVVVPDLVALLGAAPTGTKIRVWRQSESVAVAAWDGSGELPAFVLARAATSATAAEVRDELLAETRRRLDRSADVEEFSGEVTLAPQKGGGLEFSLGAGGGGRSIAGRYDFAALEAMDVRDKAVLAERRATRQRDLYLWRVLQVAVGGLVLAGLLELGLIAGGVLLRQQRESLAQVQPEVQRVQTAQALSTRIEEMSQRRLRPFEMLAVLNGVRPPGLLFTRSVTNGQGSLEVEVTTANADGVGLFESAVRALPTIESLEVRDLRLREGTTIAQLVVTFRAGSLAGIGGTEPPPPPPDQPGPGGAK
jgi:hypothetical protein